MEDLIKALQIFAKYTDSDYPTHCEHDTLYVLVDPEDVSEEDMEKLEELHFIPDCEYPYMFISYMFGSA